MDKDNMWEIKTTSTSSLINIEVGENGDVYLINVCDPNAFWNRRDFEESGFKLSAIAEASGIGVFYVMKKKIEKV